MLLKKIIYLTAISATALAGFAAACGLIGWCFASTNLRHLDAIGTKIEAAASYKSTDVLFIGTSRLVHGLSPAEFDKMLKQKTGHKHNSYNLSLPGGSLIELATLADRYFDTGPCCVKYVVLEPDFSFLDVLRQPKSPRAVAFLDAWNAYRMLQYIRHFSDQPVPKIRPSEYTKSIVTGVVLHYTYAGMIRTLFDPTQVDYRLHLGDRGFEGISTTLSAALQSNPSMRDEWAYHTKFLSDYANVGPGFALKKPNEIAEANYLYSLVSQYQFNILISLIARLEKHGVTVVLLRTPQIAHSGYALSYAAQYRERCRGGPLLFDFGNPEDYPILFSPDNRADIDHLNVNGATIFSGMLAGKIASLMDRRITPQQMRPCEN